MLFPSIFGPIENPFSEYFNAPAYAGDVESGQFGLIIFLNNLLKLITVVAAIFALFQIITAGFAFISASGDPKAINNAWNKIWQALLGVLIIASSFILAAIFGFLIFGDPTAILSPKLFGPK